MNIAILATASFQSGALTIYRQLLSYLGTIENTNNIYIFIEESMPAPEIQKVTYIKIKRQSWPRRIYWLLFGIKSWANKQGIFFDALLSLQNLGANFACKQVVYFHQAIPLYPIKWNFFKKEERLFFLYKYIYPIFIKVFSKKNTIFITQTKCIKSRLAKKLHINHENIFNYFPDVVPNIEISEINITKKPYFIYPANFLHYKNHSVIIDAIKLLSDKQRINDNTRIIFTLTKEEAQPLVRRIAELGISKYFIFLGKIPHKKLLSFYHECSALLFPSTLETIGLPLIEAAESNISILVADKDFSREVLDTIDAKNEIYFLSSSDPNEWADAIYKTQNNQFITINRSIKYQSHWKEIIHILTTP